MSTGFDVKDPGAFRYVFGSKGNEKTLKAFVNDILAFKMFVIPKYKKIQELYYRDCNPKLNRFKLNKKNADIMFADQDKNMYIVAMLNVPEPDSLLRMVFYACKTLIDEVSSGNTRNSLIEVNLVIVAAFDMFPDNANYLTQHQILSYPTCRGCTSIFWMSCANLAKFNVSIDDLNTPPSERFSKS